MKKNIAIIGAGQIGSRHLQGLSKLNIESEIYVLDKFQSSLEIARTRFLEMPSNSKIIKIHFGENFEMLPEMIDLAIIASGAEPRLQIMQALLSRGNVSFLILEKILFQSLNEYYDAEKLLLEKNVKAWVNCPRRIWEEYLIIKQYLRNSQKISFDMKGKNWGMLSNTIHMIDIFSFLCEDNEYQLDCSELEHEIVESKRSGCIEIYGTLKGTFSNGSDFAISCDRGQLSELVIEANSSEYLARTIMNVPQAETKLEICSNFKKPVLEQKFKMHFQSEITGKIAEEILLTGNCGLPSYAQSSKLHIPFIKAMIDHISLISGIQYDRLPAT